MVRINWTKQAVSDLKNIADYISKDSKKYAQFQIIRIKSRTTVLRNQLHSGKVVPELEIEQIRELIEGNYRIIYKVVDDNRADVLTVHHTSRDLTRRNIG